MAEIIVDNSSSNKKEVEFIGGITWNKDISDHLIPELSSSIEHELTGKDYTVRVEQQLKIGDEKRTLFYITTNYEVGTPEGPKRDWEKAIKSIRNSITNNFFSPNSDVSIDV